MNKSDIMKEAELAEYRIAIRDIEFDDDIELAEALIAAAELLKQVEVVSVEEIAEVLQSPVYCRPSCLSDAETLLADAAQTIHNLIYKSKPVIIDKEGV